jgi:hypothetical protein
MGDRQERERANGLTLLLTAVFLQQDSNRI